MGAATKVAMFCFDQINLTVLQRVDLRLVVGNPDPLDAIDVDHLAASKA
jgi:hypothetical protein